MNKPYYVLNTLNHVSDKLKQFQTISTILKISEQRSIGGFIEITKEESLFLQLKYNGIKIEEFSEYFWVKFEYIKLDSKIKILDELRPTNE